MVHAFATCDYPINALGTLKPPLMLHDETEIMEGETVINGVALPQQVIEELRKLGIALSWYNAGELRDAIEATHFDGQLVDDHHGVNFRDKLHHTEEEKETDEHGWNGFLRMRVRNRKRKSQVQSPQYCPADSPHKQEHSCGIYSMF
jgi:hypothetical protein